MHGSCGRTSFRHGIISFEMLSVDGTMCEACGADWHQSDKRYAHLPAKLRNVDYTAEWGKSGYRGWVYGYEAYALCNSKWQEPSVFVDGWLKPANQSETVLVRQHLEKHGLPAATRYLFADSGFDDDAASTLQKFNVSDRAKAAMYAIQKGIIRLD
jgi:hypothetical protein